MNFQRLLQLRQNIREVTGLHTRRCAPECVGGAAGLTEDGLGERYTTFCDPRLNEKQALELEIFLAVRLQHSYISCSVYQSDDITPATRHDRIQQVTECVGGAAGLTEDGLGERYTTFCDPRLNEKQAFCPPSTFIYLVFSLPKR
jgi:3-deoxy-D-arabino-heptulosonate 7-phosphate (DAHP) synthase class II